MANLTESSVYESGVPQLETTTQAIGGAGGTMNSQAQALANRTKFLKDVLDSPTELANRLPDATTDAKGKVKLASTGVQDATKVPKALGADLVALITAAGYTLNPATGTASLDGIADGTNYKRVTAAEKVALAAGYTHLQQLADAEAATALWDYDTAAKMPPALLKQIVESSSNGAATVIHDDLGFPSMMYLIRGPILAGHIHPDMGGTTLGTDEFPAFNVNNVVKNEIFISMFKMTSFNGTNYHGSGTGWRAVSWPGLYPTGSLNYDVNKTLHTSKGPGWHMMSIWERALIMWLSMKMGTEPRGNTYYGRSHESGYEYESAVRFDGLAPGTTSGTAKHRNGSCPSTWSHNRERWGIHDLVGSMYEWTDLMKIVDGLIYMPNDNYFDLAEASWPSQGVYFDNTVAGSGGAPRLNTSRVNAQIDPNYSTVVYSSLMMAAEYDALNIAVRQRMLKAGIAPKISSTGTNPWSPKGTLYMRNYGERLPICGGDWYDTSDAGLACLRLLYLRSDVYGSIGSRSAFIAI